MNTEYKKLGSYIRAIDVRNKDLKINNLLGVSISKQFIKSIANTVGTNFSSYKVVKQGQFAYGPVTSRNGDKISVALLTEKECIISSSYSVFEVIDKNKLLPEYLMLWFSRPEFDRYARFKSHGSVREIFDWDEMCNVELPVPKVKKQREIVKAYQTITDRIALKQKINDNLLAQAQIYFGNVFMGKDTEDSLPDNWVFATIGDYCVDNVSNLSKNDKYDKIFYLDTGSITKNYIVELQELNLNKDEIPSRAKRKVFHGDIVYSTVRPNLHHYGLLQNPPDNLIVSTGFAVLHSNSRKISNELIFMWLTKNSVLEYLQAIAENSVSTYPSLNVSDLLNVKIVVPDDDTLRKLNLFLSTIFSIIDENNRQIKMLLNCRALILPKLISSR